MTSSSELSGMFIQIISFHNLSSSTLKLFFLKYSTFINYLFLKLLEEMFLCLL